LGEGRELNINPKNCIGTVISLNGFRKYFCVYHAKHPENVAGSREQRRRQNNNNGAAFIGFEESESENDDIEAGNLIRQESLETEDERLNNIIFEEHLLDGLAGWLDKLFEGTTQRYHIQYWPDHMK